MKRHRSIENAFPDRAAEIRNMRQRNLAFDEACKDYELLVAELEKNANEGALSSGPESDILDSLRGLEEEISLFLTRLPRRGATP